MGKVLVNLERNEVENVECIFGRLNSLNNLTVTLASNNELFSEKSYLYERLIEDLQITKKNYSDWWQKIVEKYNLESNDLNKLNVNFRTYDLELME